jgi:hypothetical protein
VRFSEGSTVPYQELCRDAVWLQLESIDMATYAGAKRDPGRRIFFMLNFETFNGARLRAAGPWGRDWS